MRFHLLCTTIVAIPLIAGPAAARQDVVRKTALVTVVAEARAPITTLGPRDFVVREDGAVRDVLEGRLVKRNVPLKALTFGTVEKALGGTTRQKVAMQKGIPSEKAREIVKVIKGTKLKVQAAIQGDQVRVTGKNKDDLQQAIQALKGTDLGIDMQFTNYR